MAGKLTVRNLVLVSIIASLLCLSALICIPSTVPITLQTLVLFLSLFSFGGKITTAATTVYIALGLIGLPVFSGFSGGIGRLFDATAGFIIGMLFCALLWWLTERYFSRLNPAVRSVACLGVIYLTGALWYHLIYLGADANVITTLAITVIPFIVPDAIKIYIAYRISKRIAPLITPHEQRENK